METRTTDEATVAQLGMIIVTTTRVLGPGPHGSLSLAIGSVDWAGISRTDHKIFLYAAIASGLAALVTSGGADDLAGLAVLLGVVALGLAVIYFATREVVVAVGAGTGAIRTRLKAALRDEASVFVRTLMAHVQAARRP